MPFESQTMLVSIFALDVLLYIALVAGYLRSRKLSALRPNSLIEAFHLLEASLWKTFPNLPEGLTLREALMRVKKLVIGPNWDEMELLLAQYESYRYGGIEPQNPKLEQVIKLLAVLRGGGGIPKRAQIPSH